MTSIEQARTSGSTTSREADPVSDAAPPALRERLIHAGGWLLVVWASFGTVDWIDSDGALDESSIFKGLFRLAALGWGYHKGFKVWRRRYRAWRKVYHFDLESYAEAEARAGYVVPPAPHDGLSMPVDLGERRRSGGGEPAVASETQDEPELDMERVWPYFAAVGTTVFSVALMLTEGMAPDPFVLVFVTLGMYGLGVFMFSGVRMLLRSGRRNTLFSSQSFYFKIGFVLGPVCLVVFEQLVARSMVHVLGPEGVVSADVPLVTFSVSSALRFLLAAGLGGLLVDYVARRVLHLEEPD